MSETRFEVDGAVAVITLAAPDRRNALTSEMTADIVAYCDEIDARPEIGALVVRGEGPAFCAGAHRRRLADAGEDPYAPGAPGAQGSDGYSSFVRVGEVQVPSIAAVRGAAVGAGLNLAFATDLRIVAEDARLIAGFSRIGIHPGGGHLTLVGRTAGREAAAAMAVFGQEISGRRAAEIGAAFEALPADQVEPRALELARVAATDPELARATIRSLRMELGPPMLPWPAALELERSAQAWSLRRRSVQERA